MRKLVNDLTGKKFGRLTVIGVHIDNRKKTYYVCQCDCGNVKVVRADALTSGSTKSCGCLKKEQDKINLVKSQSHLMSSTRLYNIWAGIKDRCYNENNARYSRYGGRGIKMCVAWEHNFENFYIWAVKNGYAENLSIDRIDNDGDYHPNNCRWVDNKSQCNNRNTNINIKIGNTTKTMMEWCEIFNLDYGTVNARYSRDENITLDRLFSCGIVKHKRG